MKRILCLLMIAALAIACNPTPAPKSQVAVALGPVTWIDAPLDGFTLPLKPYDVVSHATFPQGITAFELSVNGQVMRSNNIPPDQSGQALAQISQTWTPPAPGTYLLAVRAANAAGVFGAPAQVHVTVGDGNPPAPRPPASSSASTSSRATSAQSSAPVSSSSSSASRPAVATAIPTRPAVSSSSSSARPLPTATFTLPPPQFKLPTATHTPIPRDTQGPPPPGQTAPTNGASLQCGNVNLTWRAVSDPSGIRDYDVELQSSTGRGAYTAYKSWDNLRSTTAAFSADCNTNYRWRVRATDNPGNVGQWSGYETFSVGSAPPR